MEKKAIVTERKISPVQRVEFGTPGGKKETFKPTPVSVPKRDLSKPPEKATFVKKDTPVKPVAPAPKEEKLPEELFDESEEYSDEPLSDEEIAFLSMGKEKLVSQATEPIKAEASVKEPPMEESIPESPCIQKEVPVEREVIVNTNIFLNTSKLKYDTKLVWEVTKDTPQYSEYVKDLQKKTVWYDNISRLVSKDAIRTLFSPYYSMIPGLTFKDKTSLFVSSVVKMPKNSMESSYLVIEAANTKPDLFNVGPEKVHVIRMFLVSTKVIFL